MCHSPAERVLLLRDPQVEKPKASDLDLVHQKNEDACCINAAEVAKSIDDVETTTLDLTVGQLEENATRTNQWPRPCGHTKTSLGQQRVGNKDWSTQTLTETQSHGPLRLPIWCCMPLTVPTCTVTWSVPWQACQLKPLMLMMKS